MFFAAREASFGPEPPALALSQVGSWLSHTGRDNVATKAVCGPKQMQGFRSTTWSRSNAERPQGRDHAFGLVRRFIQIERVERPDSA